MVFGSRTRGAALYLYRWIWLRPLVTWGDERVVYSIGCMGHGVSLTHLNGQTIRDLILERKTELSDVFFVNRTTIPWPPEPFRTIGMRAILGYMHLEDRFRHWHFMPS